MGGGGGVFDVEVVIKVVVVVVVVNVVVVRVGVVCVGVAIWGSSGIYVVVVSEGVVCAEAVVVPILPGSTASAIL